MMPFTSVVWQQPDWQRGQWREIGQTHHFHSFPREAQTRSPASLALLVNFVGNSLYYYP
jgi:hypothetical protein